MGGAPLLSAILACAGCDAPDRAAPAAGGLAEAPEPVAAEADFGALEPGDSLLGLRIDSIQIAPDPVDSFGWTGTVDYSGDVELAGEYRPHVEYPEVRETCFFVDDSVAARLPRFPNDARRSWFCFSNPSQADRLLGPPGREGRARIGIDRFHYLYQHSDVYNRARLEAAETLPAR